MKGTIVFVLGVPHSHTSAISTFLLNNGGINPSLINGFYDLPEYENKEFQYDVNEDGVVMDFLKKRKRFKKSGIKNYLNSMPNNAVTVIKNPWTTVFLNEMIDEELFKKYHIKVVFVLRNIKDFLTSNQNKYNKPLIYHLEQYVWFYDFIVNYKYDFYPLISERILERNEAEAWRLLDYCNLKNGKISFDGIKPAKKRNPTYLKYRINNFIFKLLR